MGKSHIAHTLRYNLLIKNILHLLPKYLSFVISQLNFFLCDASLTVEKFLIPRIFFYALTSVCLNYLYYMYDYI